MFKHSCWKPTTEGTTSIYPGRRMAVHIATTPTTQTRVSRGARPLFLVALVVGVAYAVWRVGTLGSGVRLALSVPLLAIEIWALIDLAAFGFRAWRISDADEARFDGSARADVVIDASSGGVDELERTLVAVQALRGAASVTVVEARGRLGIAEVARAYDARVAAVEPAEEPLTQIDPPGDQDLWLWLESGQVPLPDLIGAVAGRFEEDDLAVCQIAVDLLNADSLVHLRGGRDEDALQRSVVGPALGRRGLAPWTGAGSLIRRRALAEIEGAVGFRLCAI